jgi:subtilisin family serine protease
MAGKRVRKWLLGGSILTVAVLANTAAAGPALPNGDAATHVRVAGIPLHDSHRLRTVSTTSHVALLRSLAFPGSHPAARPKTPTSYAMSWSSQSVVVRRLSALKFSSGIAVVGVSPTTSDVALPSSVNVTSSDPKLHEMVVTGSPSALASLQSFFEGDHEIRYVEPVERLTPLHFRNDPATYNVDPGTGQPYEWAFNHVGVDRALNLSNGASSVQVGIIDSGVSPVTDLQGRVAHAFYWGYEGTDASDTDGHGTFVASIVAAGNDDGYGLAGFCGACQIVPVKDMGLTSLSVAADIRTLVDYGVKIINLSIGGPNPSFLLLDAVNYAISHGVLLVASSGNDGLPYVSYPAAWLMGDNGALGWGLAVGASDEADNRAPFSNFGPRLSLLAPGASAGGCSIGIYSALPPIATDFTDGGGCDAVKLDPLNGGSYAYASGTSFSAPEVAGVAALIWAAAPTLTNSQVADLLEKTASRPSGTGWVPDRGWGVLNAAAALEAATGGSSADEMTVQTVSVKRRHSTVTAVWFASWQDGQPVRQGIPACSASLGGRNLRPTATSGLANGSVRCSWIVPKWGVKRTLEGSLSISEDDVSTSGGQDFFFRVTSLK